LRISAIVWLDNDSGACNIRLDCDLIHHGVEAGLQGSQQLIEDAGKVPLASSCGFA
jgi:hypothetical protein